MTTPANNQATKTKRIHLADPSRRNPKTTFCSLSSCTVTETPDPDKVTCPRCLHAARWDLGRLRRLNGLPPLTP